MAPFQYKLCIIDTTRNVVVYDDARYSTSMFLDLPGAIPGHQYAVGVIRRQDQSAWQATSVTFTVPAVPQKALDSGQRSWQSTASVDGGHVYTRYVFRKRSGNRLVLDSVHVSFDLDKMEDPDDLLRRYAEALKVHGRNEELACKIRERPQRQANLEIWAAQLAQDREDVERQLQDLARAEANLAAARAAFEEEPLGAPEPTPDVLL